MKLGVNTLVKNVEVVLPLISDAGFSHVYLDGSLIGYPAERIRTIREICERLKLIPFSAHYPSPLLPRRGSDLNGFIERAKKRLEKVAEFKVEMCTLHAGTVEGIRDREIGKYVEEIGRKRFIGENVNMIKTLAEHAESIGLKLTIENMLPEHVGDLFTKMEDVLEVVEMVGMPNVGICVDSGHANVAGIDVAEAVKIAGDKLFETHFHDNFGRVSEDNFALNDLHRPPGVGNIDWISVIKALDEVGFEGPVVFELGLKGEESPQDLLLLTALSWRKFVEAERIITEG